MMRNKEKVGARIPHHIITLMSTMSYEVKDNIYRSFNENSSLFGEYEIYKLVYRDEDFGEYCSGAGYNYKKETLTFPDTYTYPMDSYVDIGSHMMVGQGYDEGFKKYNEFVDQDTDSDMSIADDYMKNRVGLEFYDKHKDTPYKLELINRVLGPLLGFKITSLKQYYELREKIEEMVAIDVQGQYELARAAMVSEFTYALGFLNNVDVA